MPAKRDKFKEAKRRGDVRVNLPANVCVRIGALLAATLPLWHARTPQEMLHPLFSSAPTQAAHTKVTSYAIMLVLFAGLAQRDAIRTLSWRSLWLVIGVWKVLSNLFVQAFGEELMSLGTGTGVVAGQLLLTAVPNVGTWIWILNSVACTEVRRHFHLFSKVFRK